ncbi:uncharacterized protein LOC125551983 isoform X1 [Triticum urartu]|uniref:uncharacterized protein LOC125551983 isoform X1 n=1 Tax=Triticum urartu TaxID=4572 RepID=UPI002044A984|nr:uncharacterized protein LOC125551983 isoform X1 [Triticum urartu]XP_048571368.1 uncharacterized protein LOC125551983 isoform X1 [Triticum urartu]XP_048571369.1 uncharacterized protein LOC125551983 isoform X1 [Triticum urartu]
MVETDPNDHGKKIMEPESEFESSNSDEDRRTQYERIGRNHVRVLQREERRQQALALRRGPVINIPGNDFFWRLIFHTYCVCNGLPLFGLQYKMLPALPAIASPCTQAGLVANDAPSGIDLPTFQPAALPWIALAETQAGPVPTDAPAWVALPPFEPAVPIVDLTGSSPEQYGHGSIRLPDHTIATENVKTETVEGEVVQTVMMPANLNIKDGTRNRGNNHSLKFQTTIDGLGYVGASPPVGYGGITHREEVPYDIAATDNPQRTWSLDAVTQNQGSGGDRSEVLIEGGNSAAKEDALKDQTDTQHTYRVRMNAMTVMTEGDKI